MYIQASHEVYYASTTTEMDDFNMRSSLEQTLPLDDGSMLLTLAEIRENIQRLRDEIAASIPPNRLTLAYVDFKRGLTRCVLLIHPKPNKGSPRESAEADQR